MCLTSKAADVKDFLKRNKGKEFVKVYKYLKAKTNRQGRSVLIAPYMKVRYYAGELDLTDRVLDQNRLKNNIKVSKGFHCYLSPKAISLAKTCDHLVPMYVKPEDIIGRQKHHAVFKRAILLKKDYKEAIDKYEIYLRNGNS